MTKPELQLPAELPTNAGSTRPADRSTAGASNRLRALASLSGSLTDALTMEVAANLVEKEALSALGATSAVVVTLGAFPPPPAGSAAPDNQKTSFHVLHAIGLRHELRAALEEQPLDAPLPFSDVARGGEALFLEYDSSLLEYREWGASMIAVGVHSAAIVPVWANGELRGVLGLFWPESRVFEEDERAFVLTLGIMCAQAVMRAHLKDAERCAREEAELANISKANFVATISHELRTPINAVIGYTEIFAEEIDGPVTDAQQRHLARLRTSGAHLLALIDQLLGFARVEAGAEIVLVAAGTLQEVVATSLELVLPLAAIKGIALRVSEPAAPIVLHTDGLKLRQILVNLVANAIKFTDVDSASRRAGECAPRRKVRRNRRARGVGHRAGHCTRRL